jgi:hypothetical protein
MNTQLGLLNVRGLGSVINCNACSENNWKLSAAGVIAYRQMLTPHALQPRADIHGL